MHTYFILTYYMKSKKTYQIARARKLWIYIHVCLYRVIWSPAAFRGHLDGLLYGVWSKIHWDCMLFRYPVCYKWNMRILVKSLMIDLTANAPDIIKCYRVPSFLFFDQTLFLQFLNFAIALCRIYVLFCEIWLQFL